MALSLPTGDWINVAVVHNLSRSMGCREVGPSMWELPFWHSGLKKLLVFCCYFCNSLINIRLTLLVKLMKYLYANVFIVALTFIRLIMHVNFKEYV